ncbi:hypothetical protein ABW19_dt0210229 [Dactylella cylindrospora]|nr:hypothetical protein ABW19_dt0210229 [Dactylella cylindrospora]
MTETTSLIPWPASGGGDSNFPQSGQVDWVALTGNITRLAADTYERISNAGVEALTFGAGQALCMQMKLGDLGTRRVLDCVSKLRAFSTPNELLYLGWGKKHPIRRLVETNEGLACVALCGCLSEAYAEYETGEILMAMYELWCPPNQLKPSLLQWTALVRCSRGALASSSFGTTLSEITRLCRLNGLKNARLDTSMDAIAQVLSAIFAVSTGKIETVKIAGEQECCLIAAIAIWLLNLTVEIRDGSGETLYSAGITPQSQNAQVLLLVGSSPQQLGILGKVYVIPPGEKWILEFKTKNDVIGAPAYSGGRIAWETALTDTFGSRAQCLFQENPDSESPMAIALGCAARIFDSLNEPFLDNILDFYRSKWEFPHASARGRGYIETACGYFPELRSLQETMLKYNGLKLKKARKQYNNIMVRTFKECNCAICGRLGYSPPKDDPNTLGAPPNPRLISEKDPTLPELTDFSSTITSCPFVEALKWFTSSRHQRYGLLYGTCIGE